MSNCSNKSHFLLHFIVIVLISKFEIVVLEITYKRTNKQFIKESVFFRGVVNFPDKIAGIIVLRI